MTCPLCDEEILDHEPRDRINGDGRAHQECLFRSVVGGVAHVEKRCSCYGGTADPDDGLSRRESAKRVWAQRGSP